MGDKDVYRKYKKNRNLLFNIFEQNKNIKAIRMGTNSTQSEEI